MFKIHFRQTRSAISQLQSALALALLSLTLYAWIAWRYPLLPGLEQGRATWGTLGGRSLSHGLLHAAVYGALVVLYAVAVRHCLLLSHSPLRWSDFEKTALFPLTPTPLPGRERGFGQHQNGIRTNPPLASSPSPHLPIIWLTWAGASLLLLFSYPGESFDIFDYLFRGRMLAEHGASPLAQSPTPFADKPFWDFITWRGQVDTYGPLWEYASGSVAWAVGALLPRPLAETTNDLAAYVTGYRLLAVAMSGLCGLIIYSMVRRHDAALTPAALLAWLWNPLLLTATAVGAHNDAIMIVFVLLALWCWQRQRWIVGLLALTLAAHVKLTALLLLPVVGLWLLRRIGWRRTCSSAVVALGIALPLSWLLYAPLGGWATLPRMLRERTLFLANSPADLVYRWLQAQQGWSEPAARQFAMSSATALFCLVAAWLLLALLRAPRVDDADLWRCGLAVSVTYLLLGSFWFMPWYVLWALPLAALLPTSTWMRRWLPTISLAALWAGLAADVLSVLYLVWLTPTVVAWIAVTVLYVPLALMWLVEAVER
jgi:hypothetical protein